MANKTSRNNPSAELLNIETYLRIRDLPNGCNSVFIQTGTSDTIRFKKDKEACNHGNVGLLAAIPSSGLFKKLDQSVNNQQKDSYFTCHRVFNEEHGQEVVYENVASPIVQDALKGFTCTIFVYGQTGSGKTYTMQGTINDQIEEGIISRAIRDIFQHFSNLSSDDDKVTIKISYCEIYKERILDLLRNSSKQEETFKVMVNGRICTEDRQKSLMQKSVKNAEAAFECLKAGNLKRNVGPTKMNEESSRSHAIFQIQIEQEKLDAQKKIIGKLFLVDLAGSENANSGGDRIEARNIKLGLNTLDRVINALHEKSTFIPHSSSQLTLFLKESLGGNSRTAFIICCSPASCNYSQTYSTLDFGSRVKNIKNKKQINVEWTAEKLKEKVAELEEKLRKIREENKIEIQDEEEMSNLRSKITELEAENETLKMDLQETETALAKEKENSMAIQEQDKKDKDILIKYMNEEKEGELGTLAQENGELVKKVDKIGTELEELKRKFDLKNAELKEAKTKNDGYEKECGELKITLEDCIGKIESTKEECGKLFEENKNLKAKNADKERIELEQKEEIEKLQKECDNLKLQNIGLQVEMMAKNTICEENELKQKKIVEELRIALEESIKIRDEQKGQMEELGMRIVELGKSNLEKDAEIGEFAEKEKENLEKLEELGGKISAKDVELHELYSVMKKQEMECEGLKNESKKLEEQISDLKKQNCELMAQHGQQIGIFESMIRDNKIGLEKSNEENESKNKRILELEQQIKEEYMKNSKSETKSKHFEHLRNQIEGQNGQLKDELDRKNGEIHEMEMKLAETTGKLEAANVKNGRLQEDCSTLKIFQEQMKRDYREQIGNHQMEIEKLKGEMELKKCQIQFTEQQFAAGKEEIEKLKSGKELSESLVQEGEKKLEAIKMEMEANIGGQMKIQRELEGELAEMKNNLQAKIDENLDYIVKIGELEKEKDKMEKRLKKMEELNKKREKEHLEYSALEKESKTELENLAETRKMVIGLLKKHLDEGTPIGKENGGEKMGKFAGKDIQQQNDTLNEKFGKIKAGFEKQNEKNRIKWKKLQGENKKLEQELKRIKNLEKERAERVLQQRNARSVSSNQRRMPPHGMFARQ